MSTHGSMPLDGDPKTPKGIKGREGNGGRCNREGSKGKETYSHTFVPCDIVHDLHVSTNSYLFGDSNWNFFDCTLNCPLFSHLFSIVVYL